MASQPKQPLVQTRPRTIKPTLKAVLSLPFRICNPPPAVGKVRSCGVTPLIKIRLEDILERKHLPPLGLKDFEEWLLYVEMSAENLYFTLWLKEYTHRYNQWIAETKSMRESSPENRNWNSHNSSLAMFYARAKQTFFTPNAEYELNLPSNVLAPFHTVNGSPCPDPAVFTEVAIETQRMLQDSLRRFVAGQLNNVGTRRVLCGIMAGTLTCLLGTIPPLAVNFAQGHSRWLRLTAFPAMWLGLTIALAALNGICLGVYIFGDLRQLRKFELSRPTISKPQPLRNPHGRPNISYPLSSSPTPQKVPEFPTPRVVFDPPPPAYTGPLRSPSRASTMTAATTVSGEESTTSCGAAGTSAAGMIQISPAYYDDDPIEGPAINPLADYRFPPNQSEDAQSRASSFTATASFIHPFEISDDDDDLEQMKSYPEERQTVSEFDFDSLPHLRSHRGVHHSPQSSLPHSRHPMAQPQAQRTFFGFQGRCCGKKSAQEEADQRDVELAASAKFGESTQTVVGSLRRQASIDSSWSRGFKKVQAVPAFASLTRVLSPVIVRGQWEIVVRSAILAFIITWAVLGGLLAVPILR
ncbi:hypothetical protein BDN72DRAFT_631368 [Pluteus cervinus]|uniref:Uncharacterized protein n=1 Tax=Pluteus cervinus TaxID=181527 RepID=A0ACD3BAB8_9AGAR|nr:hypothetical protein BDN72DRAFT_631368 [Pluteus cervinus]